MSKIIEVLYNALPEAIGGLTVLVVTGLVTHVYRRYKKLPQPEMHNSETGWQGKNEQTLHRPKRQFVLQRPADIDISEWVENGTVIGAVLTGVTAFIGSWIDNADKSIGGRLFES